MRRREYIVEEDSGEHFSKMVPLIKKFFPKLLGKHKWESRGFPAYEDGVLSFDISHKGIQEKIASVHFHSTSPYSRKNDAGFIMVSVNGKSDYKHMGLIVYTWNPGRDSDSMMNEAIDILGEMHL